MACLLAGSMFVSPIHALANPQVVIARDITAQSHCQLNTTIDPRASTKHTIHAPCPAGTVIATHVEPQSAAVATHEAYVALPTGNTSPAVARETKQQIQRLIDSTRDSAYQRNAMSGPLFANCGQELYRGAYYDITGWNGGDTGIFAYVDYTMAPQASGCNNVTIWYAQAVRDSGYANVYWQSSQYASGQWNLNCSNGCPYIGYSKLQQNINSTHSAGYWFQETFCSGSNCTWFDNTITINYLLLNGN